MNRWSWCVFAVVGLLCVFAVVPAAEPGRPAALTNNAPRPRLQIPHAGVTPRLDASPDDPAWREAAVIPALTASVSPDMPTELPPTEVRLMWDAKHLYVRFTCRDDRLDSPYRERDANHYLGDVVEVFLDPKGDGQHYLELQVGPHNQVLDQLMLITAPVRSLPDLRLANDVFPRELFAIREWNLDGLQTATQQTTEAGQTVWTVDIAIPAAGMLQRLGKSKYAAGMEMRLNLLRYDWKPATGDRKERELVALNWAPVIKGCPHFSPAAMGHITLSPPK